MKGENVKETYQRLSLEAGATHVGEKGHGWRRCPINGHWQVFQLGWGWKNDSPKSELRPLLHAGKMENPPKHYIDLVQQFERQQKAIDALGTEFTYSRMIDVQVETNKLAALFDQK